jgi:hypothetical protein
MNCSLCDAKNVRTNAFLFDGVEREVCDACVAKESSKLVRVFKIPSPNWAQFTERFEKLTRRAKRLECKVPVYTLLRDEPKTIRISPTIVDEYGHAHEGEPVERLIVIHHITIECEPVCIAGYEFCASIDHSPDGNVVHTLKGVNAIPVCYRTAAADCDHCGYQRRRNNTFVIRHIESGEYKQIGRNCLSAYIGSQSAETYADRAEHYSEYYELGEASESEGGEGWGGGGKTYVYLDNYLSIVAEVIAHVGWRSNSVAKEYGGQSTSSIAITHMTPARTRQEKENRLFEQVSNKSVESAKAAIEWCSVISDAEVSDNEYLWNIRVISKRGLIEYKQFGYAASIVSAYQKHIGELKRKEYQAKNPSNWVGEVGKRMTLTLTVVKTITLDGNYGTTTLHLMRDVDNNSYVWNSSGETFGMNETVVMKATIKRHDTYGKTGEKQTILSRCKKVEEKKGVIVL